MSNLFTIRHIKLLEKKIEEILQKAAPENLGDPEYIFLDSADFMLLLGINEHVLKYWKHKRVLPYSRIKGKVYFKLADVQRMIEEHKSESVLRG